METTRPMNLAIGGNTVGQPLYTGGFAIGQFFNKHSEGINMFIKCAFIIVMMVFIVVLVQNTIADIELMETEASLMGATSTYVNVMYHQRCKHRGGCCKTCPFISEDDPRVVIYKQMEMINSLYDQTKQGVQDDNLMVSNALDQISDATKKGTATTSWNGIVGVESSASQAIGVILGQLKDLDKTFGEVDGIDVALMDAKNKATALGAAAVVQKNIFVAASLHLNSQIMMQYIMDVSTDKQAKILDYDRLVTVSAMAANTGDKSIASIYSTNNAVNADYTMAYTGVAPSATSTSQDIVKYMAMLVSQAHTSDNTITVVISKLSEVSNAYQACRHVVDRFSNDLPGSIDNDKITALIQAGDYETAIIRTALEPDIVSNHKKFAMERSSFESGGGIQSVRDDDNDVVPWVGIFGRPTYRKSNGDSVDISTGARNDVDVLKSIPSDVPTNLMRKSSIRLGTTSYAK
jgi:hypothetical protein